MNASVQPCSCPPKKQGYNLTPAQRADAIAEADQLIIDIQQRIDDLARTRQD